MVCTTEPSNYYLFYFTCFNFFTLDIYWFLFCLCVCVCVPVCVCTCVTITLFCHLLPTFATHYPLETGRMFSRKVCQSLFITHLSLWLIHCLHHYSQKYCCTEMVSSALKERSINAFKGRFTLRLGSSF